ncbi:MAG: tetratricopeptide repeat protein [Candidatus Omnitrophica bacterium]|nr:tetratricopeptide repeat protein [Candidatus Omnitrophota bacterium]
MRLLLAGFLILTQTAAFAQSIDDQSHEANQFLQDLILKQLHQRLTFSKPVQEIETLHEKALALVGEKKYSDASRTYEEILLATPEDDETYLLLGHTYLLGGQYEKAERAFNQAIHIEPSNHGQITSFYEGVILQTPHDDTAYANLGYAYLLVGEFLKAEEAFQDALTINPQNPAALRGLSMLS